MADAAEKYENEVLGLGVLKKELNHFRNRLAQSRII